jgi:hypothetical protein
MRTKKAQHEKNILEIIRKNKVMFISHIFGYYGQISRQYFYQIGLDKSDEIKKAIADNRAKATGFMINKWIASDNPTLQVCAYKILCSDDERKRLSKDYVEVTGKNGKDLVPKIEVEIIDKLSNDENSDK